MDLLLNIDNFIVTNTRLIFVSSDAYSDGKFLWPWKQIVKS